MDISSYRFIRTYYCSSVRYIAQASFYSDVVECWNFLRRVAGSILSRGKRWLALFHLLHYRTTELWWTCYIHEHCRHYRHIADLHRITLSYYRTLMDMLHSRTLQTLQTYCRPSQNHTNHTTDLWWTCYIHEHCRHYIHIADLHRITLIILQNFDGHATFTNIADTTDIS